jgi:septum site-determining protein MinC
MLRGTPEGLEFVFDGPFEQASEDFWTRLGERPDFYRGSPALVVLGEAVPPPQVFGSFLDRVRGFGVDVRALRGPLEAAPLAREHALAFSEGGPAKIRGPRPAKGSVVALTEAARSLDADFAGARADLARRRRRGPVAVTSVQSVASVAMQKEPGTLYVRGTVRGGRSLQQLGNVVVVGDVNPGAEIVASQDIVIFGACRGTVHAGAQGDESARVFAIELMPTQLRIATLIAAEAQDVRSRPVPEEAFIEKGRIIVAARGVVR